jgi:hypothetical protein
MPNLTEYTCFTCQKQYRRESWKVRGAHTFCSNSCRGVWTSTQTGANAARWAGGVKQDRGRTLIYKPDHHRANAKGYVYRYWVVAEEKIGRELRPNEVVHHIDRDRGNDNPDNLEVMTRGEHTLLHYADRGPEHMARMRAAKGMTR